MDRTDYTALQRSYEFRLECLRRSVHEWLDVTGAIVTIVAELLTWSVRRR